MLRRALLCLVILSFTGPLVPAAPAAAQDALAQPPLTPRAIAARAAMAVAGIRARGEGGIAVGSATGFFVGEDGLLATNYHAIEGADSLDVILPDGTVLSEVALLAIDPARDLALLRVTAPAVRSLPLGSDEEASIGDRVYVMGNPLGMDGTFSDGMVSAKRRIGDRAMIQITAPIAPGSSGGPVMNEAGEVIGVVALSITKGQNLNLAVAARDLQALISTGGVARPYHRSLLPALSAPPAVGSPAADRDPPESGGG